MFDTLFWAFYWIDVLSSMNRTLFASAFFGAITAFLYVLFHDFKKPEPDPVTIRRGIFRAGLPIVLLVLAINMIPSKDTMYMMLATRVTDHAMTSETGQKLLRALNSQLDAYIERFNHKEK